MQSVISAVFARLFAIALFCCSSTGLAVAKDQESWDKVLRAIEIERSKLISASVVATGLESNSEENVVPVEMKWLFDFSKDLIAFSRTQQSSGDSEGSPRRQDVWSFPDRRVFCTSHNNSPRAVVCSASTARPRSQTGSAGFPDLRAFGLVNQYEFYRCMTLESVVERLKSDHNVRRLSNGLLELQFLSLRSRRKVVILINPDRGFTVERVLVTNGILRNGVFTPNSMAVTPETLKPMQDARVDPKEVFPDVAEDFVIKWDRRNDVWLPVHIECQATGLPQKNRSKDPKAPGYMAKKYQLKVDLHWTDVNVPVVAERFDLTEFDLPPETMVFIQGQRWRIARGTKSDLVKLKSATPAETVTD